MPTEQDRPAHAVRLPHQARTSDPVRLIGVEQLLKRGGDRRPVASNVLDLTTDENLEDVVALKEALDRLEHEDPRAALVTRLRFYAGLTVEETAKAMKLSERTVMREWAYARAWLHDALGPVGD